MFVAEGATVTAPPKITLPLTVKFVAGFKTSVAPAFTVRLLDSVPDPPKTPPDLTMTLVAVSDPLRLMVPELVSTLTTELEVACHVLVASMVSRFAELIKPVSAVPFWSEM